MNPGDCHHLVLAWSSTRGSLMVLQLIFGPMMTPVTKYLQFARRICVEILKSDNLSKISLLSEEKLEKYRLIIAAHHPTLDDVWGTMDGFMCLIEKAPNEIIQSRFYNG